MQMSTDCEELNALPELSPPPELDESVLELALVELGNAVDDPALERVPAVSGFEVFVHGAIAAAYAVYAASSAFSMLDRMLAF